MKIFRALSKLYTYLTKEESSVDYEESEKLFDSLEAKAKGTLEGFVYQHRALMEYERNNLWLALNYFEKARRLRPEDKELLSYIDMGIHRVKMLLKLK
jgi:tetratricopeptide (TPR) repeat protein